MKTILTLILIGTISHALSITQEQILKAKKEMIQQSIQSYSGNCPCPYNSMRNGRSCGHRSAYSRPGGQSPLCYPEDIPDSEAMRFIKK